MPRRIEYQTLIAQPIMASWWLFPIMGQKDMILESSYSKLLTSYTSTLLKLNSNSVEEHLITDGFTLSGSGVSILLMSYLFKRAGKRKRWLIYVLKTRLKEQRDIGPRCRALLNRTGREAQIYIAAELVAVQSYQQVSLYIDDSFMYAVSLW